MVGYAALLADQLIEPLAGHGAIARRIGIHTVIVARRLAIQRHFEAHRLHRIVVATRPYLNKTPGLHIRSILFQSVTLGPNRSGPKHDNFNSAQSERKVE